MNKLTALAVALCAVVGCTAPAMAAQSVLSHGAVCNGTNDDTAAIQGAINVAGATGDYVDFPSGQTCKTTSTLYIGDGSNTAQSSQNGVILRGFDGRNSMNWGGYATKPVNIYFSGALAAIEVRGPLQGWGVQGISIACANVPWSYGLHVVSASFGDTRNISIRDCSVGIYSEVRTAIPAGMANVDSLHNRYQNVNIIVRNAISEATYGILETGNVLAPANTAFSDYKNVNLGFIGVDYEPGAGRTTYGLYIQAADTNHYENFHIFGISGGLGGGSGGANPDKFFGVVLDYTVNPDWPNANTFDHFDLGKPPSGYLVLNYGTPSAGDSKPNWWTHAGMANGAKYPILANLLPDHASGTWTPRLFGTSGGSATYSKQVGSYEMNGYEVTARFHIVTSAMSGMAGTMMIDGFPITSTMHTDEDGTCVLATMTGVTLTGGHTALTGLVTAGQGGATLIKTGSAVAYANAAPTNFAGAVELRGYCTYKREGHR